jgi:hypothetical protein
VEICPENQPIRRQLMGKHHKKVTQDQALMSLTPSVSDIQTDDPIVVGLDNSIKVNLAKLAAPVNVYDADMAWLKHKTGVLSLFFAKRSLSEEKIFRTRLEVRFPPENFVQFWENSKDFAGRVSTFIDKWPKDEERSQLDPAGWKAEKDHSEWANFGTIAHSGTEAALDFYTLPPAGVARYIMGQGTSQLILTPVVRVQMTIFELSILLETMAVTVSNIKDYLPKSLTEEKSEEKA